MLVTQCRVLGERCRQRGLVDDPATRCPAAPPGAEELLLDSEQFHGGVVAARPPAVDDGAVAAADHAAAERWVEGDHVVVGEETVGERFDLGDW